MPSKELRAPFSEETKILARQLELWREFRGLSLRKLAKMTGVPISRIQDIKREDRADLKYTTILRLAQGLGCSVMELLYTDPSGSKPPEELPVVDTPITRTFLANATSEDLIKLSAAFFSMASHRRAKESRASNDG